MSVIGHYLEAEGIPTVSVSLIRLHTETIRPPRALWVPFELGRPLGAPHQVALQTRVLRSMLALLKRTDGPVILEDFGEDAPKASEEELQGMFCALPAFSPVKKSLSTREAILAEIGALRPWYEMAIQRNNGRTTVGASTLSIEDLLDFLLALRNQQAASALADKTLGQSMRLAAEDLRAWYTESRIARPGSNPDSGALADWFWGETLAGRLLLDLHPVALSHADPTVTFEGRTMLVPRSQAHRLGTA